MWSGIHRFGSRWRVEGAFSAIKGIFGEYATAGKFANMVKEMMMKAFIYNIYSSRGSEASRGRPAGGTAGPLAGGSCNTAVRRISSSTSTI